jgi:hypothetical protein
VYACLLATVAIGRTVGNRRSFGQVSGAALAASVLFFVVTNFAVWAHGRLYPLTWSGLAACYTAAIPFFRNSLLGDAAFTALLFGGLALLERRVSSLRERPRANPEAPRPALA